jgi:hypothetical protein
MDTVNPFRFSYTRARWLYSISKDTRFPDGHLPVVAITSHNHSYAASWILTLRPLGSGAHPQSPRGIHLTAVFAAASDEKRSDHHQVRIRCLIHIFDLFQLQQVTHSQRFRE